MKTLSKLMFFMMLLGLVAGCKKKAADAKTGDAQSEAKATTGSVTYKINPAATKVYWAGSKATGTHTGTVSVSGGTIGVNNGEIVSGTFDIDMNSLMVTDLKPEDGKAGLEGHLKGLDAEKADDFLNVTKYPSAVFTITKVEKMGTPSESATHNVSGNLSLKGLKKEITFPASIVMVGDKVSAVTPKFSINRTEWKINYGSKTIGTKIADKIISDDVAINIQLEASK